MIDLSFISFIEKHDLWIALGLDILIVGLFYFKIIRPRYLELPQLKNIFFTKEELEPRLKQAVSIDQFLEMKAIAKEIKDELKKDFRDLNKKIDSIILKRSDQ